jgi:FkbM family methyltransferase
MVVDQLAETVIMRRAEGAESGSVTNDRASFSVTLALLAKKGVRYSTVLDLGCADGHFFVQHHMLFPQSVPVNIDANALYEPSLKSIQEALGGHYRIAAVSDKAGELQLHTSIHPYWSSLRDLDDAYWQRVNGLTDGARTVPALRIDDLAVELGLEAPYLIKLDIQGAEVQALRGARNVLDKTSVVICEADLSDFQAINTELVAAGFLLYDLTQFGYAADQTLGWFYPVYLNASLAHLAPRAFWSAADNQAVIRQQIERRKNIVAHLNSVLPMLKAARRPKI